jgi:hypothetical protein
MKIAGYVDEKEEEWVLEHKTMWKVRNDDDLCAFVFEVGSPWQSVFNLWFESEAEAVEFARQSLELMTSIPFSPMEKRGERIIEGERTVCVEGTRICARRKYDIEMIRTVQPQPETREIEGKVFTFTPLPEMMVIGTTYGMSTIYFYVSKCDLTFATVDKR